MKTAEEKANKYAEEAILALYSDSELMQDFVQKQKKYAKVDFLAGYNEAMKEVKEMKANTQLIAAAPDLLEALMSLMDGVANLPPLVAIDGVLKTEWEQGLKAINKAQSNYDAGQVHALSNYGKEIYKVGFLEGQSNPKIKQLEWEEVNGLGEIGIEAKTPFGNYEVYEKSDHDGYILWWFDPKPYVFDTEIEAKMYAQADFEWRVRECLD